MHKGLSANYYFKTVEAPIGLNTIRSLVNTSIEGSNGSPTKDEVFGCFGVGRAHEDRTLSKQAREILSSSWRQSTKQQYSVYAKQWFCFCTKRKIDPFSTDTVNVIEFLTSLYNKGLKYSAINTARSDLSAFVFIDRKPVGTLPVIIRFLKGVYNLRPSLPRTGVTWDVDVVLKHLITLSPVRKLSLKMLTFKLLCLMALLSGQRIQTFQLLDIRNISITKGAIRIRIGDFLKQTRRGYQQSEIVLKCYPPDRRLCVVTIYKEYILRTETYRGDYTSLFLSLNKPFKPVSKDTLSSENKLRQKV
ncbi:uncharacterized protein LOC126811314 isoform X2 [Patella vulgata]|uniref:uncharacterized protein LOC126811314 isoform X2 n=1 Tax=Patella vulgata TaxID=6465 RepID=UPI0024A7CD3F|nr:uncharacterized protein LOC126811314 isoform X2 [Patella vulgata]